MFLGISPAELVGLAVVLLLAGALTGILAGLFGVGGGAVVVPVLYEVFRVLDVPDDVRMPLCVGTSLAVIIPTSIRSFRGHLLRKGVDTSVLKVWAVPVVLGVAAGSWVAAYADPEVFKAVFVLVAGMNATKLLFGNDTWRVAKDLPAGPVMRLYGFVVGILSALMGIGGGALCSMVMTFHGRPIHQAVSTSSGLGVLISIPGAIGYMVAGWGKSGLPPLSVGFVSLIGVALFIPTSLLTTPLGVHLAHALSRRKLEIAFGTFLAVVCARFVVAMFA